MGVIGFFVTSWLTRQSSFLFVFSFFEQNQVGFEFCSEVGKFLLDFFASNFAQKKRHAVPYRWVALSSEKERRYLTRQCYEAAKFMTHFAWEQSCSIKTPKLTQLQPQLEILVSSSKSAKLMASTDLRECDHSNKLYLQLKPNYTTLFF